MLPPEGRSRPPRGRGGTHAAHSRGRTPLLGEVEVLEDLIAPPTGGGGVVDNGSDVDGGHFRPLSAPCGATVELDLFKLSTAVSKNTQARPCFSASAIRAFSLN